MQALSAQLVDRRTRRHEMVRASSGRLPSLSTLRILNLQEEPRPTLRFVSGGVLTKSKMEDRTDETGLRRSLNPPCWFRDDGY